MITAIPDHLYQYIRPDLMTERQRKAAHYRAEFAEMKARKHEDTKPAVPSNTATRAHEAELLRARSIVDAARYHS